MRVKELFAFIKERQDIYMRCMEGQPKPWTKDPILQRYRFCNVYREQDTVTRWIADNWREPHKTDPDLWFAMLVARKINLPASLEDIGYPVPWNPNRFKTIMAKRKDAGKPLENSAYMITAGVGLDWKGVPKYRFLADAVFSPMYKDRDAITLKIRKGVTLQEIHGILEKAGNTVGSFIAGQVIADLKYVEPLKSAPDWWKWAAPGPGSLRGLNRVIGRPIKTPWPDTHWQQTLRALQPQIAILTDKHEMPLMHAQDLQNCLCEFDKYERVRLGEGRPKQLYPGT